MFNLLLLWVSSCAQSTRTVKAAVNGNTDSWSGPPIDGRRGRVIKRKMRRNCRREITEGLRGSCEGE